jgi:hypothetical protein
MYKQDYLEYHLAGACTFLSDETLEVMGYSNYKNLYPERKNPTLVYSTTGDLEGLMFGDLGDSMKLIHPEIIKDLYDKKTAQEIFPELFI